MFLPCTCHCCLASNKPGGKLGVVHALTYREEPEDGKPLAHTTLLSLDAEAGHLDVLRVLREGSD